MLINIISKREFVKWCKKQELRYNGNGEDLSPLLLGKDTSDMVEQWIVHNFIHERDITLIYAPQKIGKTHFADALGQAIAIGTDLTPHFQVTDARSVVIFNGEMRRDQLLKRKRSAERQVGSLKPNGAYCEYVTFGAQENDKVEDLTTPEGQQRFLDVIGECIDQHPNCPHARVFILDSLKTLTKGGDIVAAKWNSLFRFLDKLRREHPWTFIIIHHTNKVGTDSGTQDKAIKVDVRACLTRDAKTALSDKNLSYFPSLAEDSDKRLARQLAQRFSGKRRDAIWFLFMLEDLRDLPPSAGRPFLMEMLPEDNPPRWECTELDDQGLLIDAAGRVLEYGDENRSTGADDTSKAAPNNLPAVQPPSQPTETKLTYEQLKKADVAKVIDMLRQTVKQSGCSSRQELGIKLETDKDGIDYLMKKHDLKNEDIGL